jgi:hypothetical protein
MIYETKSKKRRAMEENKILENEKKVEITCKHIGNIKKVEIESKRT